MLVIEGDKVRRVREAGVWSFSEDGAWAAVAVRKPAHLSFYETHGFTKYGELAIEASGGGAFLGARYAELDSGRALVVDLTSMKVLIDREGLAALSPKKETLALLSLDEDTWWVDLVSLAQPDKKRRVKVGPGMFTGAPVLEFEAERTLFIRERLAVAHGDFEQWERASIDVPSGKVSPGKTVKRSRDAAPFLYTQSGDEHRDLVRAIGRSVTKPREIVPAGAHTAPYDWKRAQGSVAAAVGQPEGDCRSSIGVCSLASPAILFADTVAKKRIAEVALPAKDRLVVLKVEQLLDGGMAVTCGSDGGRSVSYVVDAQSGRAVSVPPIDCYHVVTDQERRTLLAGGSWVDLTRRPGEPWPRVATVQGDDPVPYCRIGDELAPAEECPPPDG